MPHDIQAATRSWAEAKALLAAASEALVRHFEASPEGGIDNRVRHLQAEEDSAKRRVSLCAAKVTALERLNAVEAQQSATDAQLEEDESARAYRVACAEVLAERRQAAADALTEYLIAAVGSGVVSPAFTRAPINWIGDIQRSVGYSPAEEALSFINRRSLGA